MDVSTVVAAISDAQVEVAQVCVVVLGLAAFLWSYRILRKALKEY